MKEFFASVCKPGFGYGFDPKSNSHKETSYWLGMALRAAGFTRGLSPLALDEKMI